MKKYILTALAAASAIGFCASARTLIGRVSATDDPLKGVTVSDGFNCVTTDPTGQFVIDASDDANYIFVSTPAGYLPPVDSLCHPIFYQPITDGTDIYEFSLLKNPRDDRRHAFMTQADIQVVAEEELCEYDRQVADAREYMATLGDIDIFGLDCGDIVGDHPELYQSSLRHRAALGFPVYYVMGNHDMEYTGRTHETSRHRFERNIGPSNYSFNRGDIHYIAVDNCFYIGRDYFYMGYLDERTLRWLEQDLANVPEGSTIVMYMHIPLKNEAGIHPFRYDGKSVSQETVNANYLLSMLKPYNVHMITGHQHWNNNVEHNPDFYEHNTAAACGLWWQTPVCEDGTPRGYGVYNVDGSDINWIFKSTGFPVDHQMRVYLPGAAAEAPESIVANIWNADSAWKIEWLEDDKVMGEMERFVAKDPLTLSLIADRSKLKYSWTSASPTNHMYKAKPVNPDADITVRATDRFGRVFEAKPQSLTSN